MHIIHVLIWSRIIFHAWRNKLQLYMFDLYTIDRYDYYVCIVYRAIHWKVNTPQTAFENIIITNNKMWNGLVRLD
jgi:hypothetical protein